MVCRIPRAHLLLVSLTTTCYPSMAPGQHFAAAVVRGQSETELASATNASCGLANCPPQTLTYGYYHEHWRRWPEEHPSPLSAEDLSPFARPTNNVPAVRPPNPTEEDSLAPPRRSLGGTSDEPTGATPSTTPATPARPSTPLPEADPVAPGSTEGPSSAAPDRTTTPTEPTEQPSPDGGFFPSPSDEDRPLPEAPSDMDLDVPLPPQESDGPSSADPFDTPAPESDPDDVFNLDDFSQANPRRLQRYRMSSSGQLRSSRSTAHARVNPHAAARSRLPVQLADYRRSEGRGNPLRVDRDQRMVLADRIPADSFEAEWEPVNEVLHIEPAARQLESSDRQSPPRRPSGRSNPLR